MDNVDYDCGRTRACRFREHLHRIVTHHQHTRPWMIIQRTPHLLEVRCVLAKHYECQISLHYLPFVLTCLKASRRYDDWVWLFTRTFRHRGCCIRGERQNSAYYRYTQIKLIFVDTYRRTSEICAEWYCSRSQGVAVGIDSFERYLDHVRGQVVDQRCTEWITLLVKFAVWSIDHEVSDGLFISFGGAVIEHCETRSSSGGVSEGVMRVQQTTEFDDGENHREEEQSDNRELSDGRASFVLAVIECLHGITPPPRQDQSTCNT